MSRTRKLLAAVVVAGVAAAGISAFTDSNQFQASGAKGAGDVAGYGSVTVSGVTAHSISYQTPGVGDTITKVDISLVGDTTNDDISIAFNNNNVALCSDDPGVFAAGFTTYSCDANQLVAAVTSFHLVATNKVNP
jgi:hypothetical protein